MNDIVAPSTQTFPLLNSSPLSPLFHSLSSLCLIGGYNKRACVATSKQMYQSFSLTSDFCSFVYLYEAGILRNTCNHLYNILTFLFSFLPSTNLINLLFCHIFMGCIAIYATKSEKLKFEGVKLCFW